MGAQPLLLLSSERSAGRESVGAFEDARSLPNEGLPESEEAGVVATDSNARLRELFKMHHAFIWRLVRRLGVAEHAVEDATQEVFWIAARKLHLVTGGKERSFLFGVALRTAAEWRRQQRKNPPVLGETELDSIASNTAQPDALLERKRARQMLDSILDSMPDDMRTVFVLFELESIEIPDIANMLEIPIGTVGSRLRRAREEFESASRRIKARMQFQGGAS